MTTKLILASSLAVLFILAAPVANAQLDDDEDTVTPIGYAIGFFASFLAVMLSAVAVVQLTVYPNTFWPLNFMAFIMLMISFSLGLNSRGPLFWATVFSTVIVAIIIVATIFSRNVVKKVVWG